MPFVIFPMVLKIVIILLKIIMLFKRKLVERDDAYSSDVTDSYFVEVLSAGEFELQFLRMTILSVHFSITLRTAILCSISETNKSVIVIVSYSSPEVPCTV